MVWLLQVIYNMIIDTLEFNRFVCWSIKRHIDIILYKQNDMSRADIKTFIKVCEKLSMVMYELSSLNE